jgi:hypothetical protein
VALFSGKKQKLKKTVQKKGIGRRPFAASTDGGVNFFNSGSGLPDFSWYKIPKREKYTKLPQTIPNVHKI